ncbi:MAG TPA: ATPase [Sphingomicrobium sp.]|nr:ATPase [Sphingomicrobium sp.]
MRWIVIAGALLVTPAVASAEVVSSGPNAFHLRQTYTVAAAPSAAFSSFGQIAKWWSADHTYSGDAAKLSMQMRAGGCFCEQLPGGGIEHLRVSYIDAPKRVVLTGALGPLLYQAVAGVMDVQIEATGTGSKVTMEYKAAGFASGGADKLAPLVDAVLAEQMKRFTAFAAR